MAIKCAIHYDNDDGEYNFIEVVIADNLEQAQTWGDEYFLSNCVVWVEPITEENEKEYLDYEVKDIS